MTAALAPVADGETPAEHLRNALMILRGASGNRNRDEVAVMIEEAERRVQFALDGIAAATPVREVCEHRRSYDILSARSGDMADDHGTFWGRCGDCREYFVRTEFDTQRPDETRPMNAAEFARYARPTAAPSSEVG